MTMTQVITIKVEENLNNFLNKLSEISGLAKSEIIRRVLLHFFLTVAVSPDSLRSLHELRIEFRGKLESSLLKKVEAKDILEKIY